ncbi:MAG: hypothetical protein JSS02_29440 [Planctomycetes bacterium]|nr:hypothetical protein [Planctomycetota bacterium]
MNTLIKTLLKDLVNAITSQDPNKIAAALVALFEKFSATVRHDLVDPGPPTTMGFPRVFVTKVNGIGYIEATGADESPTGFVIKQVIAKVFRTSEVSGLGNLGKDEPLSGYARGYVDKFTEIYYFVNSKGGRMIPGALGGGSSDNILVTWARDTPDANWTKVRAPRQFTGIDVMSTLL